MRKGMYLSPQEIQVMKKPGPTGGRDFRDGTDERLSNS